MHRAYSWLIPSILIFFTGCHKIVPESKNGEISAQQATLSSLSKPKLAYKDTIFYLKNQPGIYSVLPVSKPNTPGYFQANPLGLVINSTTGRINVTQSETGLRYKIYYMSPTHQRLDSAKVVISGIDYADGIYELRSTPVAYDTAFPIYNARLRLPLPCPSDDDDDDDNAGDDDDHSCVFDETDLNNDGNDDIAGVIQDKLLVDIKQGTIDLEASFHAGVFGSSNPANGVRKDFTMYYRLNDSSRQALNKISVRLYHYKRRSDIPQWLLTELNNRSRLSAEVNSWTRTSTATASRLATSSIQSITAVNQRLISKPKRPPLIIIVSLR